METLKILEMLSEATYSFCKIIWKYLWTSSVLFNLEAINLKLY